MVLFGVTLKVPSQSDWLLLPVAGALGGYLGVLIHQHVGSGSAAPVAGLAAAGVVAAGLALAGADMDAGWRGMALTGAGALVGFLVATGLVLVLGS